MQAALRLGTVPIAIVMGISLLDSASKRECAKWWCWLFWKEGIILASGAAGQHGPERIHWAREGKATTSRGLWVNNSPSKSTARTLLKSTRWAPSTGSKPFAGTSHLPGVALHPWWQLAAEVSKSGNKMTLFQAELISWKMYHLSPASTKMYWFLPDLIRAHLFSKPGKRRHEGWSEHERF